MSRKDYQALAEALKSTGATYNTIIAVAKVCKDDNPRFDHTRFFSACGINE